MTQQPRVPVPISAILTDEQLQDLHADPQGFAEMLARAENVANGKPLTVSVTEFLDNI